MAQNYGKTGNRILGVAYLTVGLPIAIVGDAMTRIGPQSGRTYILENAFNAAVKGTVMDIDSRPASRAKAIQPAQTL